MADEEQPFLGFDLRTDKKPSEETRGVRRWLRKYVYPKHPSMQVFLVILPTLAIIAILTIFVGRSKGSVLQWPGGCDLVDGGYRCQPQISHFWGQYSPYFQVPSEIPSETPASCEITFAQVLSRHGGRDPTLGKSILYAETIDRIQRHGRKFSGSYAFLTNYTYTLGADQLTAFGEQQMINSGMDFFARYSGLATTAIPFLRASGQQRVILSAQKFSQGFHEAKLAAGGPKEAQYPYDVIVISEDAGSNNTLNHGLCTNFEISNTSSIVQQAFVPNFVPAIRARLNAGLPNTNLTDRDTIFLMDLCPFETVASLLGKPSQFCALFTQNEWKHYDYYQTLGKYYGYGPGNSLGPTQGVGYVNELIARLTGKTLVDHTTSNSTIDDDPETFPLGRTLYADFGHDNDMTAVFAALGLYNSTPPLSKTALMTIEEMRGYSAAWTVPFAARAVFEKMACDGMKEEFVRVLVNGRVLPLTTCGGDILGRCVLSKFVESLSFAQGGGHWGQCFPTPQEGLSGGLDSSSYDGIGETSR